MPEDQGIEAGHEDGWSIHVPRTGFQTAQVENPDDPDPLLVSARQIRVIVHDPPLDAR
ncbi:MAG TPA: hypothetical protein VM286_09955 [Candidatus Thermoplasmatota archaeon]|nr:hypothetical protein [Candidatus Thermoplasmatota archaeon]